MINDSEGDTGDVGSSNSAEVTITPSIAWNGNYITNTDWNSTTQSAVVGQQIYLNGSPGGGTWSVNGTAVGGFDLAPDFSYGHVEALFDTSDPDVLFYWVDGGGKTVTYTVSGISASATFGVAAPLTSNVMSATAAPSSAVQYRSYEGGILYGDILGTPGMEFTLSPTGSGYGTGNYRWVQIVTSTDTEGKDSSGNVVAVSPQNGQSGLDNNYPYGSDSMGTAQDSPGALACAQAPCGTSQYVEVVRSASFQMFLMFNPGTPNSIDVPLMVTSWSFSFDYSWNGATWSGSATGATPTATLTTTFPDWISLLRNGGVQ